MNVLISFGNFISSLLQVILVGYLRTFRLNFLSSNSCAVVDKNFRGLLVMSSLPNSELALSLSESPTTSSPSNPHAPLSSSPSSNFQPSTEHATSPREELTSSQAIQQDRDLSVNMTKGSAGR